jgi:hypothetical protein
MGLDLNSLCFTYFLLEYIKFRSEILIFKPLLSRFWQRHCYKKLNLAFEKSIIVTKQTLMLIFFIHELRTAFVITRSLINNKLLVPIYSKKRAECVFFSTRLLLMQNPKVHKLKRGRAFIVLRAVRK